MAAPWRGGFSHYFIWTQNLQAPLPKNNSHSAEFRRLLYFRILVYFIEQQGQFEADFSLQ